MHIMLREHCSANTLGFTAGIEYTTKMCSASRMSRWKRAAPYGKSRPRYQPYGSAGINNPSARKTTSHGDVQWEGGNFALTRLRLHSDSCGLCQLRSPDYKKCAFSLPLADVAGDSWGLWQSIAKSAHRRYCRLVLGGWRLEGCCENQETMIEM